MTKKLWIWLFLATLLGCVSQEQPFDRFQFSLKPISENRSNELVVAENQTSPVEETLPLSEIEEVITPEKNEVKAEVEEVEENSSWGKEESEWEEESNTSNSSDHFDQELNPGDAIPTMINDRVHLSAGKYSIEESIEISPSGSFILEPGTTIEFDQCGVICEGNFIAKGTADQPIRISGEAGWDNITLSGASAYGIFEHCQISGGAGIEVSINESGSYELSDSGSNVIIGGALLFFQGAEGVIHDCEIFECFGKDTVAILDSQVDMEGNDIHDNAEQGIFIFNSNVNFNNNQVRNHRRVGLISSGNNQSQITNSKFIGNQVCGILVRDNAAPTIRKNIIGNNTEGIRYEGNARGELNDNILQGNLKWAISCSDSSAPQIIGNICKENGEVGIFLVGESKAVIKENRIVQHKKCGIWTFPGTEAEIEKNVIEKAQVGILVITPSKDNVGANAYSECEQKFAQMSAPRQGE